MILAILLGRLIEIWRLRPSWWDRGMLIVAVLAIVFGQVLANLR